MYFGNIFFCREWKKFFFTLCESRFWVIVLPILLFFIVLSGTLNYCQEVRNYFFKFCWQILSACLLQAPRQNHHHHYSAGSPQRHFSTGGYQTSGDAAWV